LLKVRVNSHLPTKGLMFYNVPTSINNRKLTFLICCWNFDFIVVCCWMWKCICLIFSFLHGK